MNSEGNRDFSRGNVDFTGEYEHRLDDRGRLAIPSAYRGLFEQGGYLLPGPDGQIELYTPEAYAAEKEVRTVADKRRPSARRLARSFFGRVRRVETDRQGRILIPPQLREERGLSGATTIIGMGDYLEIWNTSAWQSEQPRSTTPTPNCCRTWPTRSTRRRGTTAARSRDDILATSRPVMLEEVLSCSRSSRAAHYLDTTIGLGGPAEAILKRQVRWTAARQRRRSRRTGSVRAPTRGIGDRCALRRSWLDAAARTAVDTGSTPFDGVLCDLGVSSLQLDTPERGFSFQTEGPLDMQLGPLDKSQAVTADQIVNQWPTDELANLIYDYGEDRRSRRIARIIVRQRPISTTTELAQAVVDAVGMRPGAAFIQPPACSRRSAWRSTASWNVSPRSLPRCAAS